MINQVGSAGGSDEPRLGPRPGGRLPGGETMSRARAEVLELVRGQAAPVSLAALAGLSGLHVNTLRDHLEALEARRLVVSGRAEPQGRGRPARLYAATDAGDTPEYAGLAAALAASIHRRSSTPWEDAVDAGLEWGRELAQASGPPPGSESPSAGRRSDAAARRRVVALLDDLGFAPKARRQAATVRLTRCPLLDAADRYPDVVCGVHLGIVRGALGIYGASEDSVDNATLHPFSEPGACRLQLLPDRSTQSVAQS